MLSRIRQHWILWVTALIMIALAALSIRPLPAYGAAGCLGKVREQTSQWSHSSIYGSPEPGAGVHMTGHKVDIVANMIYDYCRNAQSGPLRVVKPKWVNVCWVITGKKGIIFDGIKVDPYTYSDKDGFSWNFKEFKVDDDGSAQHCESQSIPESERKWTPMNDNPRWNMWSQVVRSNAKDESWENWKYAKKDVKRYRPHADTILVDWHW